MKVLIVMRGQGGVPGNAGVPGGQIGMMKIAGALTKLGVPVHVFVGGPRARYLRGLSEIEATYLPWPLAFDRLIARQSTGLRILGDYLRRWVWKVILVRTLRRVAPAVTHIQGLEDGHALCEFYNGPTVITHWGRFARWKSKPPPLLKTTTKGGAGCLRPVVVVLGDAQAAEMAEIGVAPDAMVPPGLEVSQFTPGDRAAARHHLGRDPTAGVILYVGRLARDKNVGTLLNAFAVVAKCMPKATLVVIGDGPFADTLNTQAHDLGIALQTTFIRFVPHDALVHYYRAADLTVIPSDRLETFCMVALEAIASGSPLVITDQIPEISRRFPDVPVVSPYNLEAFSGYMIAALEGRLAPPARVAVFQYDWLSIAQQYREIYDKVCS
jgi:glycosyltransferase involved in cell wall biosynthesis